MCLTLVLLFVASLSTASSLVVCRLTTYERVTCPDDFYCCLKDQCCKLTFEDGESANESLNDWVTGLCVRTVIVSLFMIILFIIGKSIQFCRKRFCGKSCSAESSLPRYVPLEKNPFAADIGSISALIGTPFYQVNEEKKAGMKGVPMMVY